MTWTTIPTAGAKLRGATLEDLLQELRPLYADVGGDQTMVANTTLQNVTDLVVSLEASKRYTAKLRMFYTAGGAEDFKIGASWPTGAVVDFAGPGPHNGITAPGSMGDAEWVARLAATSASTTVPTGGGGTANLIAHIEFGITTGANAGNFQIMVANNAAGATAAVVKAGSWLKVYQAE